MHILEFYVLYRKFDSWYTSWTVKIEPRNCLVHSEYCFHRYNRSLCGEIWQLLSFSDFGE